jgi:aubergine-like protein
MEKSVTSSNCQKKISELDREIRTMMCQDMNNKKIETKISKSTIQDLKIKDQSNESISIKTEIFSENNCLDFSSINKCSSPEPFDLEFLPNQNLNKLPYTEKKVRLYSNLYKINLSKNYILYEYAVKFQHDEIHLSTQLKRKVISKINLQISEKYGIYLFTGNSLFATQEVKDVVNLLSVFKKFQYSILIQPTKELIQMKNCPEYMLNLYVRKPEIKTILELIIKDILRHNPSLKFVKNLYGKKYAQKGVNAHDFYNSISILPGFSTKIMFLEQGIFLNVDIKNKILSNSHCLDLIYSYIEDPKNITRDEISKINKFFKGRIVETIHTNQRFKVEMVNFERRANNYSINFENTSVLITKYYKNLYDIDINPNSPLLLIKSKGKNEQNIGRYFPPQLCLMVGLTDEMQKDFDLMQKLAKLTKQDPEDKVASINDIIKLVNEKTGISKKNQLTGIEYVLKSSFGKKEDYGIDLSEANSEFFGYMIKNPIIRGKDDKIIPDIKKPFKILDSKKINYLCIFHKEYKQIVKLLTDKIKMASEGYEISIGKSEFKEIMSEDPQEWVKLIEKNIVAGSYNLVIILLDDYLKLQGIYEPLKKHSMEDKGYITQIILTKSLLNKNSLSIVSNILLQANSKIGGCSYKIDVDVEIKKKNLMLIGVDTSRSNSNSDTLTVNDSSQRGKTLVAMCATLNNEFTKYTHKKLEVEDSSKNSFMLPISSFIYEAVCEYFKFNKKLPGGIVIYRQGVSKEQKYYLGAEIEQINSLLNSNESSDYELLAKVKIPYYYILVNKKTSLKFFESDSILNNSSIGGASKNIKSKITPTTYQYDNPDPGLLVFNSLTDPAIFEFYLQPQKVTQGTATPTNFHVAFGNLNCPELIPKLTYDLCYIYSNWRGPVRVPAPLKYAEKLAKTIPKLNSKVKNTLCYI